MATEAFIEAIQRRAPTDDRQDAERAALAVCEALGPHLAEIEARSLARGLPAGPAEALQREAYVKGLTAGDLIQRVATSLSVDPGRARELAHTVCSAIAERMDDEATKHLADAEPSIRALFIEPSAESPQRRWDPGRKGTLAGGKPGGDHPLSEAKPGQGQRDSVAATDEPYADSKLSSSRGEDDTLARGKPPGPARDD